MFPEPILVGVPAWGEEEKRILSNVTGASTLHFYKFCYGENTVIYTAENTTGTIQFSAFDVEVLAAKITTFALEQKKIREKAQAWLNAKS